MNAVLALCKAPVARASEIFAQRVGDPNPHIRLIAARFLLVRDSGNAEATAVVTAALVDSSSRLRKRAIDVIDSLGPSGGMGRCSETASAARGCPSVVGVAEPID